MHEYNMNMNDVRKLTKSQIFMFVEKINKRHEQHYEIIARIHGSYKPKGLDTTGATPIEYIIDRGGKLFQ